MEVTKNFMLEMLSNHNVTFYIPPYQRNYEWDIEQCENFFEDVVKTATRNKKGEEAEHFFGTFVHVKNESAFGQPNKLVLTDGQQRITTTMLFLTALRDTISDKSMKEMINNSYLKNSNVSDDENYKIKLKQVETDWNVYKDLVLELPVKDEDKNTYVYRNYSYFKKEIIKLIKGNEENASELISYGLAKFRIVTIELDPKANPWENPQEIFESMNSLGKPLSLSDLVRNYLLMGMEADEQEELYGNYWLPLEKNLPGHISDFIRDYMQLKGEVPFKKPTQSNHKELYAQFKKLFENKVVYEILEELREYSVYYSFIILGSASGSAKVDKKLKDFRSIGSAVSYSVLLEVIKLWKDSKITAVEVVEIIEVFMIYFLRRRILKLTQGENRVIPPLVKEIRSVVDTDDKKMFVYNMLSNLIYATRFPSDVEVLNELGNINFYNFNQNKLLLSMVEEKLTKAMPEREDPHLQIEHIMPQKLNDHWKKALGVNYEKIHENNVHKIGNITLIRHNQELGRLPFIDKKNIYQDKSGLQIAKTEIIDKDFWTEDEILGRTTWISNFIVEEVLPLPKGVRINYNRKRRRMSFEELDLIGKDINYIADKNIKALVINDRNVYYENEKWALSTLTREIETRKGTVNASGAYQGAYYWEYNGRRISEMMDNLY